MNRVATVLITLSVLAVSLPPAPSQSRAPVRAEKDGDAAMRSPRWDEAVLAYNAGLRSRRSLPASEFSPSWSPNGQWLVYDAYYPATGNYDLYVVDANGQQRRRLTRSLHNDRLPVWSPDGTRIVFHRVNAFGRGVDYWSVEPDGSGLAKLSGRDGIARGSTSEATFSKDGKRVYFIDRNGDLVELELAKNKHRLIHPGQRYGGDLTLSPDGRHLLFDAKAPGDGHGIYRLDMTSGSRELILTRDWWWDAQYSVDGKYLVMGQWDVWSGRPGRICIADADGGNRRLITPGTFDAGRPALSPDGTKIAFSGSSAPFGVDGPRLYTMHADGSRMQRLMTDDFVPVPPFEPSAEYEDYSPHLSPRGGRIVFSSNRGGIFQLHTMRPDGSDVRLLFVSRPEAGEGDGFPVWSPSGRGVAFTSDRGGNRDVWHYSTVSGALTNLTAHPSWDGRGLSWSPDGEFIAFTSNRDGDPELFTMRADGTGVRQLTWNTTIEEGPAWSPDGRSIAYASWEHGSSDIHVVDVATGVSRRLTASLSWDGGPTWSPDGRRIAFYSDRDDSCFEIYLMPATGGHWRRLTHSHNWDLDPAWERDGSSILVHSRRNGRYGIVRVPVSGDAPVRLTNRRQGSFVQALRKHGVEACRSAFEAALGSGESLFLKGELRDLVEDWIAAGRAEDALTIARWNVAAHSKEVIAFDSLARAHFANGLRPQATESDFLRMLRRGDLEEAELAWRKARDANPEWVLFVEFNAQVIGKAHLKSGNLDAAARTFQLCVAAFPKSAKSRGLLKQTRELQKRKADQR